MNKAKVSIAHSRDGGSATGTAVLPHICTIESLLLLVVVAELLALLLAVAAEGLAGLSWAHLALVSFLMQWVVLSSAALLCYLRPTMATLSPVASGLLSYAVVIACTGVYSVAGQWFLKGLGRGYIDWWQVGTHMVIAAILAGILLRYLYLQQQLQHQQQAELKARIQALQSRIEPHFLFNSMNSIASLIAVDPDLAERQVEDLSELMRASLAQSALISAERELQLCRSYVHIEQARLGDRLSVAWQVSDLPSAAMLPNLLLQPLVENAIHHGIEPCRGGGEIAVKAAVEERTLVVSVTNSLPPAPAASGRRGNRMALDNIRHRLAAHFGSEARLEVEPGDRLFTVTVCIDLRACERATINDSG